MASPEEDREIILIVEDEEPVRRTYREWLESAHLPCVVLVAGDAQAALVEANRRRVDLAILDWNLGAGNDGLRLLEDLYLFNPDLAAIMITGYAQRATPLDALRMGVRDYLDKNQHLDREVFLAAVEKQLQRIRPAKRERRLQASLAAFRQAVERILPQIASATALHDPVPVTEAIRHFVAFLMQITGASDAVLIIHSHDSNREPAESQLCYDRSGARLPESSIPFARSLASSAVSLQEPVLLDLRTAPAGTWEPQPFERGRRNVLTVPLNVAPGVQAAVELFDHPASAGFPANTKALAAAAGEFGALLLRQALAEKQANRVLQDAVQAALQGADSLAGMVEAPAADSRAVAEPMLASLRERLQSQASGIAGAEETMRLIEAIRELGLRHGPAAVRHCARLVESVAELLDAATGAGDERP